MFLCSYFDIGCDSGERLWDVPRVAQYFLMVFLVTCCKYLSSGFPSRSGMVFGICLRAVWLFLGGAVCWWNTQQQQQQPLVPESAVKACAGGELLSGPCGYFSEV